MNDVFLRNFGFTQAEHNLLRELGLTSLTDIQRAVFSALSGRQTNITVLSPTNSGKTFLFPLLALKEIIARRKCLLIVPSRSQAREVNARYLSKIEKLGYVTTFSGGMQAVSSGKLDAGVIVYEAALSKFSAIKRVFAKGGGVILLDEIDLCYSKGRAPTCEALIKGVRKIPATSIICMSALLPLDNPLVTLLNAPVIAGYKRELPLKKGVYADGKYSYEEFNTGKRGEEYINISTISANYDEQEQITRLAVHFALEGDTSLVFMKDRASTRTCARLTAASLKSKTTPLELPPEFQLLPNSFTKSILAEIIPWRIAFHNSDLTNIERNFVEEMLELGIVKTVFCTSTLGTGVNFPVDNVITETSRWDSSDGDNLVLRTITCEEFDSIAGRCSRMGMSKGIGKAIIPAHPGAAERIMEEIATPASQVFSQTQLFPGIFSQRVFFSIFTSSCCNLQEIIDYFTPNEDNNKEASQLSHLTRKIETELLSLARSSLIVKSPSSNVQEGNKYTISRLGDIIGRRGISVQSAKRLIALLDKHSSDDTDISISQWFWEITGFAECNPHLPCAGGTNPASLIDAIDSTDGIPISQMQKLGFENQQIRRLKGTSVLFCRQSGESYQDIENRFWVSSGVQERLLRVAMSLSRAALDISKARACQKLSKFFERLCNSNKPKTGGSSRNATTLPSHSASKKPSIKNNNDIADSTDKDAGKKPTQNHQSATEKNIQTEKLRIRLLGHNRDRSGEVIINDSRIRLRLSSYEILARLVKGGKENDGWVRASRLIEDGDIERARKYISHLRTELRPYLGGNPIENDGEGSYKLRGD